MPRRGGVVITLYAKRENNAEMCCFLRCLTILYQHAIMCNEIEVFYLTGLADSSQFQNYNYIVMRKDGKVTREQSQEFFAQFLRHFSFENLNPEEIQKFIKNPKKYCQQCADNIAGKSGAIILPPLPAAIPTRALVKESYIFGFFNRANVEELKATGVTLQMPKPKKLEKISTEKEILQENFPQLQNLSDEELIARATEIFPTRENLQSSMMNAIIESEEGRADTVSTKFGTWTLGFCVDTDGTLCTLFCSRFSDGWHVDCLPVRLGYQWSADCFLSLATETL